MKKATLGLASCRTWTMFACLVAILLLPGCSTSKLGGQAGPTDEDVKETIKKIFTQVYFVRNGGAVPATISFDFGQIQHGDSAMKGGMLSREDPPRLVFPVKVPVTITVTYSNNPAVNRVVRGTAFNDVFLFYRDEFHQWNFKTGTL